MSDESDSPEIGANIQREMTTVKRMIELYCRKKHRSTKGALCGSCQALLDYSIHRLEYCRFQEEKPTCRKCEVHCYNPAMREKIRQVMRFSGPRLMLRTPIIWLRHRLHDMNESSE